MGVRIVAVVALMHLAACAAQVPRQISTHNYAQAIEEATILSDLDRKADLRRCVANWQGSSSRRISFLKKILNGRNELRSDGVLLEIGSSGFPRYEYIYVESDKLMSSLENADQLNVRGTALKARLDETMELKNLTGHAYSAADDSSCYFLLIRRGRETKSIAIYGELGATTTDSLIKELLAAVGRRR